MFTYIWLLAALAAPAEKPADEFAWLTGTWEMAAGKSVIIEEWSVANDSTLSGKSYLLKEGKDTIPQETIELAHRSGQWYYIPTVQGQNNNQPVRFALIFQRGTEFISENPAHDFPQRISYRRVKDQLFASIEGRRNGQFRKQNFDFKRREN